LRKFKCLIKIIV
jgi:hypothetical protein